PRCDLQSLKARSVRVSDVVLPHQFNLILGDRRARQSFREISYDVPQTERNRDQERPRARAGCNGSQQFFICINARPSQLIKLALGRLPQYANDRLGDILHIDRLQRPNIGKTGMRRNMAKSGVRNASPGPNMTAGRINLAEGNAPRTAASPSPRLRM